MNALPLRVARRAALSFAFVASPLFVSAVVENRAHAAAATPSMGVSTQAVSVPKGQGTVEGLGESFSTSASTGAATYAIPFALPTARGDAKPMLGLSYASGAGTGVAGMGWSVGAPSISRQTDRGIPKYNDAPDGAFSPDQDRFVFDGGQELVPICVVTGATCAAAQGEAFPAWAVGAQYFRPRVEGAFQRFFWSKDRKTWRVQSKTGVTMELGAPADGANIAGALETDPAQATRIFRWNLSRQYDSQTTGQASSASPVNLVAYRYSVIDGISYLSDIYDTPGVGSGGDRLDGYAHHAHLVYEARTDAPTSYRRGWATRMSRRLAGVDVTSKETDATAPRVLVRRYHLGYAAGERVSLLASVVLEGRCASPVVEDATGALPAVTSCPSMPAMKLGYTEGGGSTQSGERFLDLGRFDRTVTTLAGAPATALDGSTLDLFDVNADGLPDVLQTASSAQVPDHGVRFNGALGVANSFGKVTPLSMVDGSPVTSADLGFGRVDTVPLDVDGDAAVDFVRFASGPTSYIFSPKRIGAGLRWTYRAMKTPTVDGAFVDLARTARTTRVMDVNGDGLVDIVMTTGSQIRTFFALGRFPSGDGRFGTARSMSASTAALSSEPASTCAPGDDRTIALDQPDVHVADMNGDGLPDLVRVNSGTVEYWPGRGDGTWGAVAPIACDPRRAAGVRAEVRMASAPAIVAGATDTVRLADVNGDGFDDLVHVSGGTVRIYVNLEGDAFAATPFEVVSGISAATTRAVRFSDVNGSGTTDIVWGLDSGYRYLDLLGGARPRLLRTVDNGLGKSTTFDYATTTSLMLEAEASKTTAWTSKMPIVVHVVRRVTESGALAVAGREAARYVTEYTYRDPVYDGRQREFRGFRETTTRGTGDTNSPASTTRSVFLTGECADETPGDATDDCSVGERFRDNGREATKGLASLIETSNDAGVFLSSVHRTHTLRHLYTGLDGRAVRHAFVSATDTWLYDVAGFAPAASAPSSAPDDVVLDGVAGTAPKRAIELKSSAGRAHQRATRTVDRFGNETETTSLGCVDGCPRTDEAITQLKTASLVAGSDSAWLWRTSATSVKGGDGVERNRREHTFDGRGNLVATRAHLTGSLPLDRSHEDPAAAIAPAPAAASRDGLITESARDYDAFGNAVFVREANNRCRKIVFDGAFATFASAELVYIGAVGADAADAGSRASEAFASSAGGAGCGVRVLPATATYDRGLGLATQTTGVHGETTRIVYDGFGRPTKLFAPDPTTLGAVSPRASLINEYDVDPTGARPYARVHTRAQDGVLASDDSYRDAWAYIDGFGRTVLSLEQADPGAGDKGAWVVRGLTDYDHKGRPQRVFLPWFSDSDPAAYALGSAPTSPFTEHRYDAFGRETQTLDTAGDVSLEVRYHALSRDAYDGADLRSSAHAGTFATETRDGHGRVVSAVERGKRDGRVEAYETRTSYLASGEPSSVVRRVVDGAGETARWMRYDSLGRLVVNAEPNTSARFAGADSAVLDLANPSRLRAARYAYDDAGRVVGTSDARGCGVNYAYDAVGRAVAEDVSPCLVAHAAYTAPNLVTGDGTEVFRRYDVADSGDDADASADVAGTCVQDASTLLGRVSSVSDRGARAVTAYDARGRTACVAKRVAKPGPPARALSDRFARGTFVSRARYDSADRAIREETGASSQELLGADGASAITTSYTKRGLVRLAGSSYGPLVTSVVRGADGLIDTVAYGDGAKTTTSMTYDVQRRVDGIQTYRAAAELWGRTTQTYPSGSGAATMQLLLEDTSISYDEVGNAVAIADHRIASEWPAGAKPVSRTMTYDDAYRLASIRYEHAPTKDSWVSPFDAENRELPSVAPRGKVAPHVAFDGRVASQTFAYDWLGNMRATDDDAHGFYDRSLGTIENGALAAKPYQLVGATNATGTVGAVSREGSLRARYDDAGNLVGLVVRRAGKCLPLGATCSQRFVYDWDEVGNLARARRWDSGDPGAPGDVLPATTPSADLAFAYDADRVRVLKSTAVGPGAVRHDAYPLRTLELRSATFDGVSYARTASTEVPYLFAHGARLGRVVYAATPVPSVSGSRQRVFLTLPDYLGSASTVIDRETGEVVERSTHQAFGAADSDYRAERWGSFRNDYRFTGKEEDIEIGLQYFGNRYYAPLLGRWVSADPLAVHKPGEGDPNVYAYVHGRVLKNTDPDGLDDGDSGSPWALRVAKDAAYGVAKFGWNFGRSLWGNEFQRQFLKFYMDNKDPNEVFRLTREEVVKLSAISEGGGISVTHSDKFEALTDRIAADMRAQVKDHGSAKAVTVGFEGRSEEGANGPGNYSAYWKGDVTFTPQTGASGFTSTKFEFKGTVEVYDRWDFDPKPDGVRNGWAEFQTRVGTYAPGTPMDIRSGRIEVNVSSYAPGAATFGREVSSAPLVAAPEGPAPVAPAPTPTP